MARSKKTSAALPLALELLTNDHRKVEALFGRYEEEKESGSRSRGDLAQRICKELTAHARLEEEIFYPWLRENLDTGSRDLVEEALVEHASAKDLIAQVEGADVDETFDAKVKVLGEYIRHHVQEEENEIFPEVAGESEELDELGQEMHARKAELTDELGLPEPGEDEEGAMAGMAMPGRRSEGRSQAQRGTH
ncbi:MAG TPA: hemerythrin domain-containing protein [Usitatibacter sp.]|nr:hemerythrin domain-containing protein [Usitatibacter sp.]